MSRKLFKQIRNEWKSNIWLALELLVVSVVLWYILDNFYVNYKILSMPLGFDVEHCYKLTFDDVTDKSPDYIPDQSLQRVKFRLIRMERHFSDNRLYYKTCCNARFHESFPLSGHTRGNSRTAFTYA